MNRLASMQSPSNELRFVEPLFESHCDVNVRHSALIRDHSNAMPGEPNGKLNVLGFVESQVHETSMDQECAFERDAPELRRPRCILRSVNRSSEGRPLVHRKPAESIISRTTGKLDTAHHG